MTFTKNKKQNPVARLLLRGSLAAAMLFGSGLFYSANASITVESAPMDITVVSVGSCSITIDGSTTRYYDFHDVASGTGGNHGSFDVKVVCNDSGLTSSFKGRVISGGSWDDSIQSIRLDNGVGRLQLLDSKGTPAILNGSNQLCSMSGALERTCTYTPMLEIYAGAPTGPATLGVSFEVSFS